MYCGFVQVTVGSNAAVTHLKLALACPQRQREAPASTSQSILSRHLLGLENPQILTFNSAGIQLMKRDKHSNLSVVSALPFID